MAKQQKFKTFIKNGVLFGISVGFIATAIVIFSFGASKIPDFESFDERKVARSTKIYDRTGEIVLFNIHEDIKRTVLPFEEMGVYIKNASVAIEDSEFYNHRGIRPKAILRAVWVNLTSGQLKQGGSTITQQIVKNTLLTREKTIVRKLKEWSLSLKIEQVMTKEEILGIYLNEAPYGGNIYGIQEASNSFFGVDPVDLTLAQASYLAGIPKAPTFFSPYGKNTDKLEARKNTVLKRMFDLEFITQEELESALNEKVEFQPPQQFGIQAPHFVFFVREYLENKYGKDVVEQGGLKVITSLDFDLQQKAEEIVLRHALKNEADWDASNAGLVAIDPKTGQILTMVGSRNYFDEEIDGNFNIAVAERQPGSSFKPFIYATAYNKGYTPDTVLFNLRTEFQLTCDIHGNALPGQDQEECYSPSNFNDVYSGPITTRDALGQSVNVASVKLLYLAGLNDSVKTAKNMGIKTLGDPNTYGLTLALGGGEVSLLDMTSAYSTFATGGIHHDFKSILLVEDSEGNVLEQYRDTSQRALPKNTALLISDVLSDNEARTPLFGANSFMYFGENRDVAGKTGTTNDNRDAWMLGYSPNIAVGVWSGNNDNSPMKKGSSISGRLWREFMDVALAKLPNEQFESPIITYDTPDTKPILRGIWQGNDIVTIDTVSGKLATELTPKETLKELVITNVHSILYWIDKKNPTGDIPTDPFVDKQTERWEELVANWWQANASLNNTIDESDIPTEFDDVHTIENQPIASIVGIDESRIYNQNEQITLSLDYSGAFPLQKIDVFVNNTYVGSDSTLPYNYTFNLSDINNITSATQIKIVGFDSIFNNVSNTSVVQVNI